MLRAGKTCKNGLAGPLRWAKGAAEEREELQEPTLGNADHFTAHLQNLVGPEAKGQGSELSSANASPDRFEAGTG